MSTDTDNRFKTAADVAYEVICEKIIGGELRPGEKLTRRGMAQLTGVSIIPVIEALHRLENEGLVDSEPHFGSHVIRLTDDTIRDKFAMRLAVECQVARILAKHHSDEQIGHLTYLSDALDKTPRDPEHADVFRERHYAFHLTIAEYTRCSSLVQALRRLNLFDLLQRSILNYSTHHSDVPKNHHQKIVDAIASGDAEKADNVMRDHIYFSGLMKQEDL